jgi:hypothetical protein
MTYQEAINWLISKKYYDDNESMAEYQRIYNGKVDEIIKLLMLHLEKPVIEGEGDCPGGVCGTGGRV